MGRLLSQPWFRIVGVPFLAVACVLGLARFYGISSWSDVRAVRGMSAECHPVWKEFMRGRIRAGQDVEEVIARTSPPVVERFGRYVRLGYQDESKGLCFTALSVVAKDGKLVAAGAASCTWHKIFFDLSSKDDAKEFHAAHDEYRKSKLLPRILGELMDAVIWF